ncbi:hypothetical protein F2Q70_00011106 [Brassica cretica]|uniref:Uncharacterized protein n=1 Tax=Brassica cretica TaxID=69181 RepID=A0A8S9MDH0_BRACR|nr:hypothetical protein F2Q70_00011106 [Brassica cretica]
MMIKLPSARSKKKDDHHEATSYHLLLFLRQIIFIRDKRWQLSCTDPPCPAPPRYTVNAGLGGTGPRGMWSLDVLPNPDPRLAQALAVQARGIPIFINTCASDGNWAVPIRCVPSRHL